MRILIISPKFPPANAADLHRVRMLIPHLVEQGHHIEVIALDSTQIPGVPDPWLAAGIPASVPVHTVRAPEGLWKRIPGLGCLEFRCLGVMRRKGDQVLAARKFDIIFISTTIFEVFTLGPHWLKKFGVPFVLDYQDPWVNDYYREHRDVRPPGGKFKHGIVDFLHRWMEPRVLRHCAGIVAVSPAYPRQIEARYPSLHNIQYLVQPFPGDQLDLNRAKSDGGRNRFFDPADGKLHWVYAGVIHHAMETTIRALFQALRDHAPPSLSEKLRLHFVGTSYSSSRVQAQPRVLPIAKEYGLEDMVREFPERVELSAVLACIQDAHALFVLGTNDPGYTASKIYPYLLTRKPLLIAFHEESSVHDLLRKVGGAVAAPFNAATTVAELSDLMWHYWLEDRQYERALPLDTAKFHPYTAESQAAELTDFFATLVPQKA
jgi:hypothetical protein